MTVVLYAFALQLVHALPVMKRIVVDPLITSPQANTVWTPGSSQLVTWYDLAVSVSASAYTQFAHLIPRDTSVVPSDGTFPGMLVLGRQTPGSENLDLGKLHVTTGPPLAFTVPDPLPLKITLSQMIFPFGMVRYMSPARRSHPGAIT